MSATITGLAVAGNTLNLAYNVPLVWRIVRTGSANDISMYFLMLRISGSVCWLVYAVFADDIWILISYLVTLTSSLIMLLVKVKGSCCVARSLKEPEANESTDDGSTTIRKPPYRLSIV